MDEKKRIIEFDAAESVPVDGQMAIDSASQGTKKITPTLLLKSINDLLGDVPLETQAQVLTAAVNEVNSKASQAIHLTQDEWDALPNTKYTDDIAYYITDGESTVGTALWTKVGTAGLNTNAKNCSGAINELKQSLDNKVNGSGLIKLFGNSDARYCKITLTGAPSSYGYGGAFIATSKTVFHIQFNGNTITVNNVVGTTSTPTISGNTITIDSGWAYSQWFVNLFGGITNYINSIEFTAS